MYYYFLWAKKAFQESRAYILAPREKVNSSSVTKLSTSSKTLLIVVSFHVLFLILNLYVFAKLAEETDPSIFARKRRFWILCGETEKPFQNSKCFISWKPLIPKWKKDNCLRVENYSSSYLHLFISFFSFSTFTSYCLQQPMHLRNHILAILCKSQVLAYQSKIIYIDIIMQICAVIFLFLSNTEYKYQDNIWHIVLLY